MAIYKPTYCYPYGGNVDFCVDPDTKAIYLQCKINTSNKKVTGYKLVLADGEGNTIWEPKYVSPIGIIKTPQEEIIDVLDYVDYGPQKGKGHGEGFNGDTLIIPFIQNLQSFTGASVYFSSNCLYTNIDKTVDYFINSPVTTVADVNNSAEVKDWNNNFPNSLQIPIGARVLVYNSENAPMYQIYKVVNSTTLQDTGELSGDTNYNIYVKYGVEYHESVLNVATSTEDSATRIYNWLQYLDSYSTNGAVTEARFKSINPVVGNGYSWKIILYQGEATSGISNLFTKYYLDDVDKGSTDWWPGSYSYVRYCEYSDEYNINQYDILITQGQILGSTGERLQIYPADVVLQKYYVQLGHATLNNNGIVTDWEPISGRANIQIYDGTYGHIYPQEGVFVENFLERNKEINGCVVYKHSNNPDENLDSDMVKAATINNMTTTELQDIIFHIFNGGLMTIDEVELEDGDLVLLKDLTGYEYLNGVYVVSASLTGWKRSGSYSEWNQFLGKILLSKYGSKNGWHNFQSQAQAGGVIGSLTGSGINANHPIAGCAIFESDDPFESDPVLFNFYQYINNTWGDPVDVVPVEQLISLYGGQYVFIFEKGGTPGSAKLYRYFIPSDAQAFNDFQQSILTSGSILAVKELTPSFGFVSLNVNGNNWSWSVNNLTSEQKGSELFFIPEQPITLYPHFENLSEEPSFGEISAVYLGEQQETSPYILQYEIKSLTGSNNVDSTTEKVTLTNLPQILIDNKELDVNDKFLGIYEQLTGTNYDSTIQVSYVVLKQDIASDVGETVRAYGMKLNGGYYVIDDTKFLDVSVLNGADTLEYDEDEDNGTWNLTYYSASYYNGVPHLTRSEHGSVPLRTKIIVNTVIDTTPTKGEYVMDDSDNLVSPTQNPSSFFLGEYRIFSKTSTYWNLEFHSLTGHTGSSGSDNIPNKSFLVEKGDILGNVNVMTVGTYNSPIVQYGITNAVGMLNINSTTKTYIKPSNNIKANQYLVFTEVDEPERKIVDPVDLVNYGVSFEGIIPEPVYSSVNNNAEKTPYKYKIVSYFKESDYNPITYSGNAKIGFSCVNDGSYAYNQMSQITAESKSFVLDGAVYAVNIDQQISISNSSPDILLRGYYQQGAGKRWEYYRMAIFDENSILLQDTGNIYEGDFSQYFWGIRPNANASSIKYSLLIVEDEFGKIYTTGVKISLSASSSTSASFTLENIRYNYNLQSVDINLTVGSSAYTLYRKELNSLKGMELVDHLGTGTSNRSWNIRDYNITNNRKYSYYINEDNTNRKLTLLGTSNITTSGKCWSITELYPMDLPEDMENSLTIKKKYIVDENNVWLFKYNGEFGSQTQNIAKAEQGTLGKYPRMGHGMRNNQTGSVSCLLGSEIIPGQQEENATIVKGYQERLRSARYNNAITPTRSLTSSNCAIDMLNAWRAFVQSKNPKLLKDVKGQSWIVQITSNQNTPMAHVQGQPDSISFSWVQIGDAKDIIISGNIDRSLTSDY